MKQRKALPHVAARMFGRVLAVDPPAMKVIVDSLGERILIGAMADDDDTGTPKAVDVARQRLSAIADGRPVEVGDGMAEYCVTPDGVGVLPIVGALSQRFDWLASWCGMTTYDGIGAAIRAMMADPSVKAIMLDVDSPGGEAAGMIECSERILEARKIKPVWAVANGLAASAAYGIAGSADKLYVPQMGYVGSIGVMAVHVDRSAQDKQLGLKYTAIYSGARKVDGWDHAPLGAEAERRFQRAIDQGRDKFCALVGRQGRCSAEQAKATEAACLADDEAVTAKLADGVMGFDEALARLNDLAANRPAKSAAVRFAVNPAEGTKAMADKQNPAGADPVTPKDKAEQPKTDPAPAANAEAEKKLGMLEAQQARATEILDLCTLAGMAEKAAAFIRSDMSVATVREQLAKAKADASDRQPLDASRPASGTSGNNGWDKIVDRENARAGFGGGR